MPTFRAGSSGVPVVLTVSGSSDWTGATAVIKVQTANGATITKAATVNSGARTLSFTTTATDLVVPGEAIAQGVLILSGGHPRPTGKASFTIEGTL
jgi:hypothetical protein